MYEKMGLIFKEKGDTETAIEYLNNSISINSKNWLAHRTIFGIKYPGYGDPAIEPEIVALRSVSPIIQKTALELRRSRTERNNIAKKYDKILTYL